MEYQVDYKYWATKNTRFDTILNIQPKNQLIIGGKAQFEYKTTGNCKLNQCEIT